MGSTGQNSTFSEHNHVAYQIKGDHECSSMVESIPTHLNPTHLLTFGLESKGQIQLFQDMVMLHIKLKRFANAATWKQDQSLEMILKNIATRQKTSEIIVILAGVHYVMWHFGVFRDLLGPL